MTWKTYEVTAFAEDDLVADGHLNCGDTFKMPSHATTCIEIRDNDTKLSGDNWCNENANDKKGQHAKIIGPDGEEGNGRQVYAEQYWWVSDENGNWYVMVEIEQEGTNDDYFTFFTGGGYDVPPAGACLTVHSKCNVKGEWLDYACLDGGEKKPPEPEFRECDDPNAVLIDFDLAAGTVVDNEYAGVTISAQRTKNNTAENDAMVFDSANPTGGDSDLASDTQGGVLIVSEDNDSSDPDDAIGGEICFDFDNAAFIYDVKILDAEEGGKIDLFDRDGNLISSVVIPNGVDGGIQQVLIDTAGVVSMKITLNGSGAVDDLCYVPSGEIGGRYFCDENNNDVDDGEPGVEGATVWLLQDGQIIASTTTDADGNYCFQDVEVGDGYSVRFEDPEDVAGQAGKTFVDPNVGSDDEVDSDVTSVGGAGNGNTATFSLAAGEVKKNVDAGIEEELGSLSGRYFCDDDGDGLDNDGADNGIAGVTVELLDAAGNGTGITTLTDDDGNYSFVDLVPGTYGVKFTDTVSGKVLTTTNVDGDASDDIDSDATDIGGGMSTITGIEVFANQNTPDNDAGVVPNTPPETVDDAAELCEGTMKEINVLDNDPADADGDTVTVTEIKDADETAGVGDSITLANGTVVTLLDADGNVKIDASGVAEDLIDLGETSMDEFQYTVSDGQDTAMGTVDVTVKGSRDTGEEVSNYLDMVVDCVEIDIDFTTANGPLERLVTIDATQDNIDGTYLGFCIDEDNRDIDFDPQEAKVYGTDGTIPAGTVDLEDRLDNVTWILNQDYSAEFAANPFGFYSQLQEAIWWVIENDREERDTNGDETGIPLDLADADPIVQQIVNDALTLGEGFEADQAGELYGMVIVPENGTQAFIVGVPWEELAEECVCPTDGGGGGTGGFL